MYQDGHKLAAASSSSSSIRQSCCFQKPHKIQCTDAASRHVSLIHKAKHMTPQHSTAIVVQQHCLPQQAYHSTADSVQYS